MMNRVKFAATVVVALSFAAFAGNAVAATAWQQSHPRRAEVNARLANQNRRIHDEVKEGDMSRAEATKLHAEHREIRSEERTMASQNGGHITKAEQRALNQQENAISREIGR